MSERMPYGSWPSPVGADWIARASVRLGQVEVSEAGVWWEESRPAEGGRSVVVRCDPDGGVHDVLPEGFNARTRVHEYGGGSYAVWGSTLFFSNWTDQRLWRLDEGAEAVPVTPMPDEPAGVRYADGSVTPDGRWIVCVRETHLAGAEPVNEVVAVPSDGSGEPVVVASGHDFFSFPRISPDGTQLAWTSWDHPDMPWDATTLWLASLGPDGSVSGAQAVAGGSSESVFQPRWSPDGALHFISDRSGWWNLYRLVGDNVRPLAPMDADCGVPQWVFGLSTYAFGDDGRIAIAYGDRGVWRLGVIHPGSGRIEDAGAPYTSVTYVHALGDKVAFVAAAPSEPASVVLVDASTGVSEVVRRASSEQMDPRYVSLPEAIEFPSADAEAYAFFYPPTNPDCEGMTHEKPPLLVLSHGGPTAHVTSAFSPQIQFWTTRGFAVVDVNYSGSTGYGRAYRERLTRRWGIVDVADCVAAARFLAERGNVDPARMAIRGGSAGGYATLCALAFHDVFAAGANYYGVADLEALARDTHKFEARYLDGLVGTYPDDRATYEERSPLHHADGISCPLITFQGLEDEVVPPAQSEQIVAALRERGVPHAYVAYEGEQHGFRRAENIQHSLGAELAFYGRVFGFDPADACPDPQIVGL